MEGTTTTKPEGRPRYTLRDAGDALQPRPPKREIVGKLITAGSVGVIYGEAGAKKTYSALSLGVNVSIEKPWLGFKTYQTTVLFIDEESGEDRLSRRLGEVLRGENCDSGTPFFYVWLAGFKMDDKNDPTILQALIESVGAGLVIIDALADVMAGDENSKEDVQPVFNHLRKIADQTGAAILIIHHSNKTGGYRGSSAIKGAVDLMVKVESEDGKNIVNFTSEKNRDGEPQNWAAIATWLELEQTFTLRTCETTKGQHYSKSQDYVINFLRVNGPCPLSIIEGGADSCSAAAARQATYSLAHLKIVRRTNPNEKGRGVEAIYELIESE